MTDLVTDAAIDAAGGPIDHELIEFMTVDEQKAYRRSIKKQLERAAPHIAAEALRRASNEPLIQTLNVVDAQESWRLMLRRLSDELEGK